MSAFAAVCAFDSAAAARACRMLEAAPSAPARVLCFDHEGLHDMRADTLAELQDELAENPVRAAAALAHTDPRRSANTMGAVPDHAVVSLAGHITNLRPLRKYLIAAGWIDHNVDTAGVVARLVDFHLRKGKSAIDAVRTSIQRLQGAAAAVIILPSQPDTIFVAAKKADVFVGFAGGAVCAVSAARLRPPGSEFFVLQADDVAVLTPDRIVMTDPDGMQIVKHRASPALAALSLHTAAP